MPLRSDARVSPMRPVRTSSLTPCGRTSSSKESTSSGESIERELALIKVTAPPERRAELLALADVFHARVADLGPEALVFEVVGSPEEIDSFEELIRPHGVKELVRTGRIGLTRASDRQGIKRRQNVLR